jgi:hypothetical protein
MKRRYQLSPYERWMTRRALAKDAELRRPREFTAQDRTRESLRFLDSFDPEFAAMLREHYRAGAGA